MTDVAPKPRRIGRQNVSVLMAEDLLVLTRLGATDKYEYAAAAGISPKMAAYRLERLVEAGFAESWKRQGRAKQYTSVLKPASGASGETSEREKGRRA